MNNDTIYLRVFDKIQNVIQKCLINWCAVLSDNAILGKRVQRFTDGHRSLRIELSNYYIYICLLSDWKHDVMMSGHDELPALFVILFPCSTVDIRISNDFLLYSSCRHANESYVWVIYWRYQKFVRAIECCTLVRKRVAKKVKCAQQTGFDRPISLRQNGFWGLISTIAYALNPTHW